MTRGEVKDNLNDDEIYEKYQEEIREIEHKILETCEVKDGFILWARLVAMLIIKSGYRKLVNLVPDNNSNFHPMGWECPKCHKVNAPFVRNCDC